ncbi:MAG TPA: AAA family ATPase, partial [Ilumatobacteraceae bacterium]|nr:AAA family ATPase [Ilumatobacteraceae bacterium]
MAAAVVGRDTELVAVWDLVDARSEDGPAGLALWGDAGIGKSKIWRAGVSRAGERGRRVLACQPTAAEIRLSYSGLTDLLADVPSAAFDGLTAPQRRALDAALLLDDHDDRGPDQRAVAAAFLSILNDEACAAPVLVAIDDVQWLDEPTWRVVAYAMRRCRGPVRLLTAERASEVTDSSRGLLCTPDPSQMVSMRLGPLSVGALHQVLRNETGRSLSRPTMVRIAALTSGNPFYALEVVRSLPRVASGPVHLPSSTDGIVRDRLETLDPSVRDALLVASAVADPRLELVKRACGAADVAGLLSSAEESGLVEFVDGRIRFSHPLWANTVYNEATPNQRRVLHRRLSGLVGDLEERARHLALS